jgi:hypothetical protein
MGVAALLATVLHGIEAATWASAYQLLGATRHQACNALFSQPNNKLRPCEPLSERTMATDGCFGGAKRDASVRLTTAFLFAMIQKVWPLGSRGWHRKA